MGWITWTLVSVFVAVIGFLAYAALETGELTSLQYRSPKGGCRVVSTPVGPEDGQVFGDTFFFTSDNRTWMATGPFSPPETSALLGSPNGGLFWLKLGNKEEKPQAVEGVLPSSFHPHGLHVYPINNTTVLLSVINHTPEGDRVEFFEATREGDDNWSHRHLDSLRHSELRQLNDVVVHSFDASQKRVEFYSTNWRLHTSNSWAAIGEMISQKPQHAIVHCTALLKSPGEVHCSVEAIGFMSNGVTESPDRNWVFVADSRRRVLAFKRLSSSLQLARFISLPFAPDNLDCHQEWDEKRGQYQEKITLFVAGHPKLLSFLRHAQVFKTSHEYVPAPSSASKIVFDPVGEKDSIEELYVGEDVYGASVAAFDKKNNQFIVGNVLHDKVLICSLN